MARPLRIQYPGAIYHVMNRGLSRQKIFLSQKHYSYFLGLLKDSVEQWEINIHAVSLMPNHYHLLIETPHANISRAMRHINGVYTQKFNLIKNKDGPLFRGRYKSILVQENAYLVELLRYIHLNPVEARIVKSPQDHQWTSHRAYLMDDKNWNWLTTDLLLSYFGKRLNRARRKLHEFVIQGVPQGLQKNLEGSKWPTVLGKENFEEWVKWNFVKDLKDKEIQFVKNPAYDRKINPRDLRKIIQEILSVSWAQLVTPVGKVQRQKRAIAVALFRKHIQLPYSELSKTFGNLNPASISRMIKKTPKSDPDLWEYLNAEIQNAKRKT